MTFQPFSKKNSLFCFGAGAIFGDVGGWPLFALTTHILYWKMQRSRDQSGSYRALHLQRKVTVENTKFSTCHENWMCKLIATSSNFACPRSNSWISPNTALATKNDIWTAPNIAPATKTECATRMQLHQVLCMPREVYYPFTLLFFYFFILWLYYFWNQLFFCSTILWFHCLLLYHSLMLLFFYATILGFQYAFLHFSLTLLFFYSTILWLY